MLGFYVLISLLHCKFISDFISLAQCLIGTCPSNKDTHIGLQFSSAKPPRVTTPTSGTNIAIKPTTSKSSLITSYHPTNNQQQVLWTPPLKQTLNPPTFHHFLTGTLVQVTSLNCLDFWNRLLTRFLVLLLHLHILFALEQPEQSFKVWDHIHSCLKLWRLLIILGMKLPASSLCLSSVAAPGFTKPQPH